MHYVNLCVILLLACLVPALAQDNSVLEEDKKFYSSRYDILDVDLIFRNSRLLNNYVECLLDRKPCPPEGKDLKRVLPHALRTSCARCTKIQKSKALDAITRLYYQHPSMYLALAERYDPTGEYTKNFENWFDEQQRDKSQFNELPQKVTRIPSTWVTSSTPPPRTSQPTTTARPTLRTLPSTIRVKTLPTDRPSVTQRPQTTTSFVVYPLERRMPVQQEPIPSDVRQPVFTREQNLSPPPSSSFRPFQQPTTTTTNAADRTFRTSTQRTFPTGGVRATTTTFRTSALPTANPRSPLPTNAATAAAARPQLLPAANAAASGRNPPAVRVGAGATLLPAVQSTSRAPLPSTALPAVALQAVPVSADTLQPVPSADLTPPPPLSPQPAAAPSVEPAQVFGTVQQLPTVTFRTPLVQRPRPALSLSDPDLIDNFFVPRTGPIRRSINQLLDTTGQAVNNVVRSLFNG